MPYQPKCWLLLLTPCTLSDCLLDASYTTYIHNYEARTNRTNRTNRLELAEYLVPGGGWVEGVVVVVSLHISCIGEGGVHKMSDIILDQLPLYTRETHLIL